MSKVISGTDVKLQISVEPMSGFTLADYDFDIYLVGGGLKKAKLTFSKKGKEGENNATISNGLKLSDDGKSCVVAFNTAELGLGPVTAQIKAYIPDGAFEDRTRTEISELKTGIDIVNSIV